MKKWAAVPPAGRYLLGGMIILFVPLLLLQPDGKALAAAYLLLLAVVMVPLFGIVHNWWVPLTLGLIILLPGPLDRMIVAVQLTFEAGANPYGLISVIDLIMFFTIAYSLWKRSQLNKLFDPRLDYVRISLFAITLLGICSSVFSYLNFSNFHLPMAIRAVFYAVRFLLVYAWIQTFVTSLADFKKLFYGLLLITAGFIFLVLLSPKENYEGGNRLSVATYGVNTFGHLLAFMSLLLVPFVGYFKTKRWFKMLLLAGLCLSACVLFLLMSANRMSSGLLLFGIFTYNFFIPMPFYKKMRRALVAGIAFIAAVALFALVKPELFARIFSVFDIVSGEDAVDNISELQSRFVVWNISLEMILQHPLLGVGPGQWNYLKNSFGSFPPWMSTILDPHNGYLLYASEMGLICLVIYYSIIIYAIRRGAKAFRHLKKLHLQQPSTDLQFYLSYILMITVVIVCWLLSDLTNASGLNIRVQSLMWSFCSMLILAPNFVARFQQQPAQTDATS